MAVKFSTVGEFKALLANDTLPDAAPSPEGVNVTVNCACCPAGIVTGNDNPVTAKAEPVTLSEEHNHSLTSCAERPVLLAIRSHDHVAEGQGCGRHGQLSLGHGRTRTAERYGQIRV